MRCFCNLLRSRSYQDLTDVEVNVVKSASSQLQASESASEKLLSMNTSHLSSGKTWMTVSKLLGSALSGVVCVLRSRIQWERSSLQEKQKPLKELVDTEAFMAQVKVCTPALNEIVNDVAHSTGPVDQVLPSISNAVETEIFAGLAIALSLPTLSISKDAQLLLIMLSLLGSPTSDRFLVEIIWQRRIWNDAGNLIDHPEDLMPISPALRSIFSDPTKLRTTLSELGKCNVLTENPEGLYVLEPVTKQKIRLELCSCQYKPLRLQALYLAARSVPWKYASPRDCDSNTILTHLECTINHCIERGDFKDLDLRTTKHLVLTLLESSRFKRAGWRRSTITSAKQICSRLDHRELDMAIAQRECVLQRLDGNSDEAISIVAGCRAFPLELQRLDNQNLLILTDHLRMEEALNFQQCGQLKEALDTLKKWQPQSDAQSQAGITIQLRRHTLLGKILRMRGDFAEAIVHLNEARKLIEQHHDICFGEVRAEVFCNIADTLSEIEDPITAENLLLEEMAQHNATGSASISALRISLAECFFARHRLEDARAICESLAPLKLLREGRLRRALILARIHHVKQDWLLALNHWGQALEQVGKVPLTTAETTRIILFSMRHAEIRQGSPERIEQIDRLTAAYMDKPPIKDFWIAGMRRWLLILQKS